MIDRIIEFSLRNRFIVVAVYRASGGLGLLGVVAHADRSRYPTCRTTRSSSSPTGSGAARRKSKTRSPIR